ncbi:MAG: PhoU domain-containing protein [Candidatus Aminicenantes bacterium]|nr:MAG: PhoU domain-containing protein [Candidatus Aminicenantes bacterium]
MFKKLISIFRKDSLMDHAYQRSYLMLEQTLEMFIKARESLRHKEDSEIDVNIYDKDAEINKFEREVRRDVFNHLSVRGAERLPSGLVLASIIIDIERIGDYTKNIVELALNHPGKLQGGKYEKDLQKIEAAMEDNFVKTRRCFESCDEASALQLLDEYKWVNPICDKILMGLIKEEDEDIQPGDAVSLGLYFRWLKRINSHLRNITTSIVNPFDRIGFEPE